MNFKPNDLIVLEELNYPTTRKLAQTFTGPYET